MDGKSEKNDEVHLKESNYGILEEVAVGTPQHPKAFISYAWTDEQHKERVQLLADRLLSKGIDVILDLYDNKPGHELNHFMEQSATNPSVTHVLIMADKIYAEKADSRKGGVGTETQLISQEVYPKILQTKVVALVLEKDENGDPYLPTYIKTRHYIDFSDQKQFDEKFDELVRHIYDKPKHVKPKLGPIPDFTETTVHAATKLPSKKVDKNPKSNSSHLESASKELIQVLYSQRDISGNKAPVDERILEDINAAEPYVNAYLNELDALLDKEEINVKKLVEKLDHLLSSAISNQAPMPGLTSWRDSDYENIGFVTQEIAISIIALLVKHRQYEAIDKLINRTYFYKKHNGELIAMKFGDFYQYSHILDDYRNQRLSLNRVSVAADIYKDNSSKYDAIDFDDFRNADSLIYLLTRFNFPEDRYSWWFPKLSVYASRFEGKIAPLGELISKTRANEISKLFGKNNIDEVLAKYETIKEETSKISYNTGWDYNVPDINNMFPEEIGKLP